MKPNFDQKTKGTKLREAKTKFREVFGFPPGAAADDFTPTMANSKAATPRKNKSTTITKGSAAVSFTPTMVNETVAIQPEKGGKFYQSEPSHESKFN